MFFPYCRAGLRTQLPSVTSTEACSWWSWITNWDDIFPSLRTNTNLGQRIYPISTYFAKLSQIYNIQKPYTSICMGWIPHTRINQSLKIFVKIILFFNMSNKKDLLILSVGLCSLYCKMQMLPLAIFTRRMWPTWLQSQLSPLGTRRFNTNCHSKLCIREKILQKEWKGIWGTAVITWPPKQVLAVCTASTFLAQSNGLTDTGISGPAMKSKVTLT